VIYETTAWRIDCERGRTHEWHPDLSREGMIRLARDNGWGVRRGTGGKVLVVACPEHNDFDNG
jgi:hypothetical protein